MKKRRNIIYEEYTADNVVKVFFELTILSKKVYTITINPKSSRETYASFTDLNWDKEQALVIAESLLNQLNNGTPITAITI